MSCIHAVIDLRWMVPGYTGGIENQMRAFLETLLQVDATNRYTVLLPSEAVCDFDFSARKNFHVLAADGPHHYAERAAWFLAGRRQPFRSPSLARLAAQADGVYTVAGYNYPDFRDLPNVLSVADLQHEYLPDLFDPTELDKRRRVYRETILAAHHVCAISSFTRQTLLEKFGLPPDRVSVTPLAVHPLLEALAAQPERCPDVLSRYSLTPGFLYYPANTWPHKNHAGLLRALALLREDGLTASLVCSGAPKEAQSELEALVGSLALGTQVRFLGHIPLAEVAALYHHCAALVFPSRFEGFGMPVLEAMRFGKPVACSRATSLPEIAGDAALFFDPAQPGEIAAALRHLLTRPDLCQELVERGWVQAARFTWREHTLAVRNSLLRTAGGSPGENPAPALPLNMRAQKARALFEQLRSAPAPAWRSLPLFWAWPRLWFYHAAYPALRDRLLRGKLSRLL